LRMCLLFSIQYTNVSDGETNIALFDVEYLRNNTRWTDALLPEITKGK